MGVEGSPVARLVVEAEEGHVSNLGIRVENGTLVLLGRGLRPNIVLEEVRADGTGHITTARFRGRGCGALIVGLFRGMALKAIRKMTFHTELARLLRGELIAGPEKSEAAGSGSGAQGPPAQGAHPAPRTQAKDKDTRESKDAASGSGAGSGFLSLVREIRVTESRLSAFSGRRLSFGEFLAFDIANTGDAEGAPEAFAIALEELVYRPSTTGSASEFLAKGRIDGVLANGELVFEGDRAAFSTGSLVNARFATETTPAGRVETSVTASRLSLRLSSGRLRLPGGVRVALADGSDFAVEDLSVAPAGDVSGLFDFSLRGETGEIERQGSVLSLRRALVKAKGLALKGGRATGGVDLAFDYSVVYPFEVKYPMPEIPNRRVDLNFGGSMNAALRLDSVGKDSGSVAGRYAFRIPWAPVEEAAREVLKARWTQDFKGVVKQVSFNLEPTRFGPCGEACFLVRLKISAEKAKSRFLHQNCEPEGRAHLVIDKGARAFRISGLKVETHCEGLFGKLLNLIAPLLAKTYEDIELFRVPDGLPFTVEDVKSGNDWIEATGQLNWEPLPPATAASR